MREERERGSDEMEVRERGKEDGMGEVRGCIIISITIKVWFHEEEKLGHSLISQPKRGERDGEKG